MITTASRTHAMSQTTSLTPPASTAQRRITRTVYQVVPVTMFVLPSSLFVESPETTTDVDVQLTLTVLGSGLITSVTLTPMAAQKAVIQIPTVLMTSVTSKMTPTPHAHTVKISTVNQDVLLMNGALLALSV